MRFPEFFVLQLSGNHAVQKHCAGYVWLDNAFVLIEGHPTATSNAKANAGRSILWREDFVAVGDLGGFA